MRAATSATWYGVLDVEPGGAAREIRAARGAAVADLDPTDRTFRVYNQAAEVLLDPARRAAYDAELVEAEEQAEAAAAPAPGVERIAAPAGAAPAAVAAVDRGPAARSW